MEVAVVRDAIAGIEQVDSAMPTVIVLDIFLPGPNGLAFLHELRSFSDTGDIPVIIWTTATMKDTLDQFSPYGVTAVIDKSLATLDELVVAIKKAVRV
jgi:CheY-like chemotaxis protein